MTCCYVNYLDVQRNYCNNLVEGGGAGITQFLDKRCTCPNIVSQLRK